VDAVDECTDREDLLAGLSVLQSLLDLKVNILVASRGENDFKDAFDGLPSLVPSPLLGRIYDEDLILLSASLNAGAGTVEGSGVQGEEDGGDQMHEQNTTKENREIDIGRRQEVENLYGKQLMYYTISRAFFWASLVSLHRTVFPPDPLCLKEKKNPYPLPHQKNRLTMPMTRPSLHYAIACSSFHASHVLP
jgi:hypothetical protein